MLRPMLPTPFTPPLTAFAQLPKTIARQGFAVLDAAALEACTGCALADLAALTPSWDTLARDQYLKDGGRYRLRRHACYRQQSQALTDVGQRPHWQPLEYNALHGGLERWFEPVEQSISNSPAWRGLITGLGLACARAGGMPAADWFIEAHQFRIDTTDGIGRPTPEGAHRDGVDFVAVLLIDRVAIKGGETRVFESSGRHGQRFTLSEPFSVLLLDDARVIHESTPIQPIEPAHSGHRDSLVITYRRAGFQGPALSGST